MADGCVGGSALEKGAESSGEIHGLGWRVFRQKDNGKNAYVLAVYVAPSVRRKMRLPVEQRKLTTPELRARFAKGAAAQMIREYARSPEPAASALRPDPTAITFDEFARMWTSGKLAQMYPGHVRAKSSAHADIQRLDLMKPLIGDVPLKAFRVEHAEEVLAALPKDFRDTTRRHYAQTLRRVLTLACYPGKILERHPLPSNFLPRVGPGRAKSFLYPVEEASLLACRPVPLERRMLYGFLGREGMRFGEAADLRWSDLDLSAGVVVLDKTKTREPRSWKLGEDVVRALAIWKERADGAEPDDRIFLDSNGGAFVGKKLATTFREDLQRAGIERQQLY
jgi:integrase